MSAREVVIHGADDVTALLYFKSDPIKNIAAFYNNGPKYSNSKLYCSKQRNITFLPMNGISTFSS